MRQVLVQGDGPHHKVDGHRLHLFAESDIVLRPGLNILRRSMPIEVVQGNKLEFMFVTGRDIATKGVLYVSGYIENNEIISMVWNTSADEFAVKKGTELIVGYAFEVVLMHPFKGDFKGLIVVGDKPSVEKQKKGKKKPKL